MPTVKRVSAVNSQPESSSFEDTLGWDYLELDEHIRTVVYGNPATGKTTLASSFPGQILWLICSGHVRSGELRSIDEDTKKKITPKLIRKSDDAHEAASYAEKTGKFETIVIDHISGIQTLMAMEVLKLKEAPLMYGRSNAQAAKGATLVTKQEWGAIGMECLKILRPLVGLPCNLVVIGQQKEFKPSEDDSGGGSSEIGQTYVGVGVIPSLAREINSTLDFILQTFIQPKYIEKVQQSSIPGTPPILTRSREPNVFQYCCRTGTHDLFTTKFRLPRKLADKRPHYIVNPTYAKIVAVTKGKRVSDE